MENCPHPHPHPHPHHHHHRIILTWSTVPPWPRQSSRRYEEEPPLSCRPLYAPGDFKYGNHDDYGKEYSFDVDDQVFYS